MWIFGYGSLVWYTNFPVVRSVPGYVKGFSRRFCQASPDHRGTPDQPGRTVSLIEDSPNSFVWGVAYEVAKEEVDRVRDYLNWREKAGYEPTQVEFHPEPSLQMPSFKLNVYISPRTQENIYHIHQESLEDIAEQVVKCVGPSGSNIEYVLRLAASVRQLNPSIEDDHLFSLEKLVLKKCREKSIADPVIQELGHVL